MSTNATDNSFSIATSVGLNGEPTHWVLIYSSATAGVTAYPFDSVSDALMAVIAGRLDTCEDDTDRFLEVLSTHNHKMNMFPGDDMMMYGMYPMRFACLPRITIADARFDY